MQSVDNCENCGRAIGRLEQPHVWRKHVVCAECHVHLSTPAHAAAPLAARPQVRVPAASSKGNGRPPAPIALEPEGPKPTAAPMLLCAGCGQSRPFDDMVSDHGKVLCRPCSRAAAAEKAARAAQEKQQKTVVRALIAVAAVVVLAGAGVAMFMIVRSGSGTTVAHSSSTTAPAPGPAVASQSPPAREAKAAPIRAETHVAAAPEVVETPKPEAGPRTLFPEASLAPTTQAPPAPVEHPTPAPSAIAQVVPQSPVNTQHVPTEVVTPKVEVPTAPEPKVEAPPREGTVERSIYDGKALLAQGKAQGALEKFTEVLKKDRNHADAIHGSGLALLGSGARDMAVERLERAVSLYDPPNRAAVYNLAVALLKDNPMRAAKVCRDYLAREGVPPDEPLHTLMGRALFSITARTTRQNQVYQDAEKFYFEYNENLETGRPDGRKRWGGEWLSGGDATARWNRWSTRRANVERLRSEVDQADKRKDVAFGRLDDIKRGMRLYGDREKREARQKYEEAARAEIAVRNQLKAAETEFNSTEKPPFPQVVRPVPMDSTAPPPPGPTQQSVFR